MSKTIKEHIVDLSKQYPGQTFSSDDIAKMVSTLSGATTRSVKDLLNKLTKSGTEQFIKRIDLTTYQFGGISKTERPKNKTKSSPKMKGRTFVAIVRDHSGSMGNIATAAMKDFNDTLENLQKNSKLSATTLTVIECGIEAGRSVYNYSSGSHVNVAQSNVPVDNVRPLVTYPTPGGTPLLDSIGKAIQELESIPNVQPIDAFMVVVITDGREEHSKIWDVLAVNRAIQQKQQTGQWTFAFRVPRGQRHYVSNLGVPPENIFEWETTIKGMYDSSAVTMNAMDSYYQTRSLGGTKTDRFFADTSNLNTNVLNQNLQDISRELSVHRVVVGDPTSIKEFFQRAVGEYRTGCGFYQLVKNEKIQNHKQLIIRDKNSGVAYTGSTSRMLLGLPAVGDVKVAPGSYSQYDIYVQSTSVNRLLPLGTNVLYWKNAK